MSIPNQKINFRSFYSPFLRFPSKPPASSGKPIYFFRGDPTNGGSDAAPERKERNIRSPQKNCKEEKKVAFPKLARVLKCRKLLLDIQTFKFENKSHQLMIGKLVAFTHNFLSKLCVLNYLNYKKC